MKKISLFLILCFVLTSCRIEGVESIYIGTVEMKVENPEDILVRYPNIDFVLPSFIDGFVSGFNSKQEEMPSHTLMKSTVLKETDGIKINYDAAIIDNQYTFMKNNFDYHSLNESEVESILRKGRSDYWLEMKLSTSPWEQYVRANLTLYLNGHVFYHKKVKVESKHIILDKQSPYHSYLDKKLEILYSDDYKEEMKALYKDLGVQLAQKIKKDFVDGAEYNEYKMKQKEIREYYKKERKSTTTVPALEKVDEQKDDETSDETKSEDEKKKEGDE